jgi:hypothetical protein
MDKPIFSKSVIPEHVRRNWPDLAVDQKAWSLACVALPEGTISEKAARAQEYKIALLRGDKM